MIRVLRWFVWYWFSGRYVIAEAEVYSELLQTVCWYQTHAVVVPIRPVIARRSDREKAAIH